MSPCIVCSLSCSCREPALVKTSRAHEAFTIEQLAQACGSFPGKDIACIDFIVPQAFSKPNLVALPKK
jgi:hypothetical protein